MDKNNPLICSKCGGQMQPTLVEDLYECEEIECRRVVAVGREA